MKTEANEPASPTIIGRDGIYPQVGSEQWQLPGLSKREYFAAMAMQGEMAAGGSDFNTDHVNRIAEISVAMADALIEQLNKTS